MYLKQKYTIRLLPIRCAGPSDGVFARGAATSPKLQQATTTPGHCPGRNAVWRPLRPRRKLATLPNSHLTLKKCSLLPKVPRE